jgi:hypothetical protein
VSSVNEIFEHKCICKTLAWLEIPPEGTPLNRLLFRVSRKSTKEATVRVAHYQVRQIKIEFFPTEDNQHFPSGSAYSAVRPLTKIEPADQLPTTHPNLSVWLLFGPNCASLPHVLCNCQFYFGGDKRGWMREHARKLFKIHSDTCEQRSTHERGKGWRGVIVTHLL